MEEIRDAAMAYYAHLPDKQKERARQFFKSMDKDGDGRISLDEYVVFLRQRDVPEMSTAGFFKELDEDGNGSLDFYEAMTLFYIIESGRRIFCNGCSAFLKGVYFTCVQCFSGTGAASYNLCALATGTSISSTTTTLFFVIILPCFSARDASWIGDRRRQRRRS